MYVLMYSILVIHVFLFQFTRTENQEIREDSERDFKLFCTRKFKKITHPLIGTGVFFVAGPCVVRPFLRPSVTTVLQCLKDNKIIVAHPSFTTEFSRKKTF